MLLLARAEARGTEMRRQLDLAAELRRAAEIHHEMGDAVILSLAVEQAPVVAAPLAVRRTLTNLIDNGLRHGTRVVLSLCEDRGRWRIDISDDGPVIAPDNSVVWASRSAGSIPRATGALGGRGSGWRSFVR